MTDQESKFLISCNFFLLFLFQLFYACISLLRWNNAVQSQSGIGIAGVLLVALTVAAGLGITSVLRIAFNASTTQVRQLVFANNADPDWSSVIWVLTVFYRDSKIHQQMTKQATFMVNGTESYKKVFLRENRYLFVL